MRALLTHIFVKDGGRICASPTCPAVNGAHDKVLILTYPIPYRVFRISPCLNPTGVCVDEMNQFYTAPRVFNDGGCISIQRFEAWAPGA